MVPLHWSVQCNQRVNETLVWLSWFYEVSSQRDFLDSCFLISLHLSHWMICLTLFSLDVFITVKYWYIATAGILTEKSYSLQLTIDYYLFVVLPSTHSFYDTIYPHTTFNSCHLVIIKMVIWYNLPHLIRTYIWEHTSQRLFRS